MPIVELELVINGEAEKLGSELIQRLADQIGDYFGSDPADTWLRVRYLDRSQYAENRSRVPDSLKPTFVSILKYQLPGEDKLVEGARRLAEITANCIGRPLENTHIIFEPDGRGRVAFGGELVT
jgi:phenylpyruvate tautomerase PptA (4-oxalocrotonate tautomerase family)